MKDHKIIQRFKTSIFLWMPWVQLAGKHRARCSLPLLTV